MHRARFSSRSLCSLAAALGLIFFPNINAAEELAPTREIRDFNKSYFPFMQVKDAAAWKTRRGEIVRRVLVAASLWPMPEKTPLNAVIHGRVYSGDYTVDKVFFESLPGNFVTGSLYLPKEHGNKIPAVLCPHGHWPGGRFMDDQKNVKQQLENGAEKFESGARSPLQARCVQLARMGCAVFLYDMLGYADSVQFFDEQGKVGHRHGVQPHGFLSAEADLSLQGYFPLQIWNGERALDFLLDLPFVDKTRVGCTGASGGGTQTLVLTGIDERITAAFPCVMTSTAMQGGCTCENSNYLRIGQGNVDIAALTAPRPLGMTSAKDWTEQLEMKGFPDLKNLYTMLGVPGRVEAHFNTQFPHNYNGVTREQMYEFFNRHFNLGLTNTEERDFKLLSPAELMVWDEKHPKPDGDKIGEPHERAVVAWFAHQDEKRVEMLLQSHSATEKEKAREVFDAAWKIMIGRTLPKKNESAFALGTKDDKGDFFLMRGATNCDGESVNCTFLYPKTWNNSVVLWLTLKGETSIINTNGDLTENARKLLNEGYAIACPTLYMTGATQTPHEFNNRKSDSYGAFSGYHYGYNPSLFAERVHDALAMIGMIRDNEKHRTQKIIVAGSEGAGVIATATTAIARSSVDRAVLDTEGFRFAKLNNVWDVNFVPGAVKYGDVPALLFLCNSVTLTVLGETTEPVGAEAVVRAIVKQ